MSKLVKKSHLQSVIFNLWTKIKARFLDKTGDHILSGKITLMNGYIAGGVITGFNNPNSMLLAPGTGHYCGSSSLSIPANREISHIVFAVDDSLRIGDVIDGVNIGIVRSRDHEVLEIIKDNASYPVLKNEYENITADRVVMVEINKVYSEEVYVIFGARGLLWNDTIRGGGRLLSCVGGNTLPQVGNRLPSTTGNYIGRFEIYSKGISLRELATPSTTRSGNEVTREEFEALVSRLEEYMSQQSI